MKPGRLAFYLAAFLAVAAFYYGYDVYWGGKQARELEAETRIFDLNVDEIKAIRYGIGGREFDIEGEGVDGWRIRRPLNTPADRWTVEGMIRSALEGKKARRLTVEPGVLAEFGLDHPEITLTLLGNPPGETTRPYQPLAPTLAIGKENPIGRSRYARLGGDLGDVFLVSNEYFRELKKSVYDLRDKSLVLFPGEKIDRIRIKTGEEVILEKKSLRTWVITSPRPGPADNDVVQRLVYSGLKGRADRFEVPDRNGPDYGFDRPRVEIEVMSEGKKVAELVMGSSIASPDDPEKKDETWVKSSERPEVAAIGPRQVESLNLGYDLLRDRHVLPLNRRTLTELKITRGDRVFHAIKKEALWETVQPAEAVSKDMDIEDFLMAVEDLKFVRPLDEEPEQAGTSAQQVTVEMTGLDEQKRILKIDLTPIEEKYIPVRTGPGPAVLVERDKLVPKLPEEIRPEENREISP